MSAGILSVISLAKETVWGTPVTPSKSLGVNPTGGMEVKNNSQYLQAIKAQIAKNYDSIIGKRSYEGSYTFDAFGDYLGYFLLSGLGADAAALHAGETIVYDHVFTESTTHPSLTIEQAVSENTRRYAGSITNDLKFEYKVGEVVKVTASELAKSQTSSTAITPAFSTVPAFNFAQVVVKIGGTTLGEVESAEVEYKNNLEMVYTLSSNDPQFYSAKPSEVSGKLSLYLDAASATRLTNYLAGTDEAIELVATGKSIGSTANYVLDILIPQAHYETANTKVTDSHNLLEIEFNGIYNSATNQLLKITLTNLVASY